MPSMGLRTAADIEAEYTAVRAAYLKAIEAESYTVGAGVSRSVTRPKSESLREQMLSLEREYKRISGGGIKIFGVVPSV
jgi:hypothetical protein